MSEVSTQTALAQSDQVSQAAMNHESPVQQQAVAERLREQAREANLANRVVPPLSPEEQARAEEVRLRVGEGLVQRSESGSYHDALAELADQEEISSPSQPQSPEEPSSSPSPHDETMQPSPRKKSISILSDAPQVQIGQEVARRKQHRSQERWQKFRDKEYKQHLKEEKKQTETELKEAKRHRKEMKKVGNLAMTTEYYTQILELRAQLKEIKGKKVTFVKAIAPCVGNVLFGDITGAAARESINIENQLAAQDIPIGGLAFAAEAALRAQNPEALEASREQIMGQIERGREVAIGSAQATLEDIAFMQEHLPSDTENLASRDQQAAELSKNAGFLELSRSGDAGEALWQAMQSVKEEYAKQMIHGGTTGEVKAVDLEKHLVKIIKESGQYRAVTHMLVEFGITDFSRIAEMQELEFKTAQLIHEGGIEALDEKYAKDAKDQVIYIRLQGQPGRPNHIKSFFFSTPALADLQRWYQYNDTARKAGGVASGVGLFAAKRLPRYVAAGAVGFLTASNPLGWVAGVGATAFVSRQIAQRHMAVRQAAFHQQVFYGEARTVIPTGGVSSEGTVISVPQGESTNSQPSTQENNPMITLETGSVSPSQRPEAQSLPNKMTRQEKKAVIAEAKANAKRAKIEAKNNQRRETQYSYAANASELMQRMQQHLEHGITRDSFGAAMREYADVVSRRNLRGGVKGAGINIAGLEVNPDIEEQFNQIAGRLRTEIFASANTVFGVTGEISELGRSQQLAAVFVEMVAERESEIMSQYRQSQEAQIRERRSAGRIAALTSIAFGAAGHELGNIGHAVAANLDHQTPGSVHAPDVPGLPLDNPQAVQETISIDNLLHHTLNVNTGIDWDHPQGTGHFEMVNGAPTYFTDGTPGGITHLYSPNGIGPDGTVHYVAIDTSHIPNNTIVFDNAHTYQISVWDDKTHQYVEEQITGGQLLREFGKPDAQGNLTQLNCTVSTGQDLPGGRFQSYESVTASGQVWNGQPDTVTTVTTTIETPTSTDDLQAIANNINNAPDIQKQGFLAKVINPDSKQEEIEIFKNNQLVEVIRWDDPTARTLRFVNFQSNGTVSSAEALSTPDNDEFFAYAFTDGSMLDHAQSFVSVSEYGDHTILFSDYNYFVDSHGDLYDAVTHKNLGHLTFENTSHASHVQWKVLLNGHELPNVKYSDDSVGEFVIGQSDVQSVMQTSTAQINSESPFSHFLSNPVVESAEMLVFTGTIVAAGVLFLRASYNSQKPPVVASVLPGTERANNPQPIIDATNLAVPQVQQEDKEEDPIHADEDAVAESHRQQPGKQEESPKASVSAQQPESDKQSKKEKAEIIDSIKDLYKNLSSREAGMIQSNPKRLGKAIRKILPLLDKIRVFPEKEAILKILKEQNLFLEHKTVPAELRYCVRVQEVGDKLKLSDEIMQASMRDRAGNRDLFNLLYLYTTDNTIDPMQIGEVVGKAVGKFSVNTANKKTPSVQLSEYLASLVAKLEAITHEENRKMLLKIGEAMVAKPEVGQRVIKQMDNPLVIFMKVDDTAKELGLNDAMMEQIMEGNVGNGMKSFWQINYLFMNPEFDQEQFAAVLAKVGTFHGSSNKELSKYLETVEKELNEVKKLSFVTLLPSRDDEADSISPLREIRKREYLRNILDAIESE